MTTDDKNKSKKGPATYDSGGTPPPPAPPPPSPPPPTPRDPDQ